MPVHQLFPVGQLQSFLAFIRKHRPFVSGPSCFQPLSLTLALIGLLSLPAPIGLSLLQRRR